MGWDLPKCLLPCPGGTLLDNTLGALSSRGVSRIAIVVGYKREHVEAAVGKQALTVDFLVNADYATTNTLHSLHLARELLREGALYFNGDVWFSEPAIDALRNNGRDDSTLLIVQRKCGLEEVKAVVSAEGRVRRIGKDLAPESAAGEFIGMARFAAPTGAALADDLERCINDEASATRFFEFSLNHILDAHSVRAAFVDSVDAIELDTPQDYDTARQLWSKPPEPQ